MKKVKITDVLMVVAILLILVYIFFQVYSVTHVDLKTNEAVISTVYDKIETKALAVREERPVTAPQGVVCVPAVADGEKVKTGGNVAMTFASAKEATEYSKYTALQNELAYYERLQTQTLGHTAGIESLNAEIATDVDDYIRAVDRGDLVTADGRSERLNDCLLRRQMTIGEEVDLMGVIGALTKETQKYASAATPSGFVTTEVSGVFTSYTDGMESILPYNKAESATVEEIEAAMQKAEQKKTGEKNAFGKLVTSYAWYLECVLEPKEVKNLKNGQSVEIALKSSDNILSGDIISGAEPQEGAKKTALIIRCNTLDSALAALRYEDIEIRIKKYEGIKIPADALHKKDDKKGVYALIASQVRFREVEVIYADDDYVMVKYDEDNPDGIRLYDKIIIRGKELADGKVYT